MPEEMLRGVLFDAGDTLIRPIGGRWNPRFDFESVVAQHLPGLRPEAFPGAFAAGQRAMDASPATLARDDYHRVILRELGIDAPSTELLAELDRPLDHPVVECFPEVRGVLEALRARGVRLAIVSDGWPSLEHLLQQLDLRRYFEVVVLSSVLGRNKPDPRMYLTASEALELSPDACLFVDDDPGFVAAAVALGYHGVAIARDAPLPHDVPSITSLDALLPQFGIP